MWARNTPEPCVPSFVLITQGVPPTLDTALLVSCHVPTCAVVGIGTPPSFIFCDARSLSLLLWIPSPLFRTITPIRSKARTTDTPLLVIECPILGMTASQSTGQPLCNSLPPSSSTTIESLRGSIIRTFQPAASASSFILFVLYRLGALDSMIRRGSMIAGPREVLLRLLPYGVARNGT